MAYNQDLRMVRLTINNLAKMRAEEIGRAHV